MLFAFAGGGKMGTALINGLLRSGKAPDQILVADPFAPARAALEKILPRECIIPDPELMMERPWDVLIVAVKPQQVSALFQACQGGISNWRERLVISVAAGTSIARIRSLLGVDARVVRAMPNTPALVGMGVTVLATSPPAGRAELQLATDLFAAVGAVHVLDEKYLDAVTALSGSGPAYFFRLMGAMTKWGVDEGLSPEIAADLSWRTGRGAAELLTETKDLSEASFEKQVAVVASKGGTTEAALKSLSDNEFERIVAEALDAAKTRSEELERME